ncbi:hypothetical protein V5R04_13105 [Jonesiaceae bacterium BS-20]|uniref:PH domain-containing protein n=1 Tax=Jonesiaceae bacterium BS-20 TaxID=3120821 RepID=A0AAU7DV56_9MICO
MERALLQWGSILAVLAIFFVVSRYARKRPHRSGKHPNRVRAPKITGFIGWLAVLAGLLFTTVSFTGPASATMPLGAKITAIGLVVLGVVFLQVYFRWYLIVEYDFIERRGMILPPRRIKYADITGLTFASANGMQHMTVTGANGQSLSLNITVFKVDKLLAWNDFFRQMGRSPSPQEVQFHRDTGQWPGLAPYSPQHGSGRK